MNCENTFSDCTKLASVTIPSSVQSIGASAFSKSGLASVTIPASVESIGENAFDSCYSLTSVTFEGTSCGIGDACFTNIGALKECTLTLPTGWKGTTPNSEDGSWYGGKFSYTPAAPAHTHEVGTKHEAVAPTCTADGTIEWYSCKDTNCEAYLDAEGKELESIVDPATGHTYGDPEAKWEGDMCTATRTCSVCEAGTDGHSISEAQQGTYVKDTDATCIAAETGHYAVTFTDTQFGSAQTEADSVTNGVPNPANHCGKEILDETTVKAATCVAEGYTGDTICSECKAVVKAGTATDKDPANHATEGRTPVAAQEATCQHIGWDAYEECACGEKIGYKEYVLC